MLGIVISVVALAAVVWWALRQEPPTLPHTAGEVAALVGAIALYGVNTLVRSERWHRLLLDDGAHPPPADSYSLTTIGYAVNNVLPARAGDAVRVLLMAPRADCSKRTVLGTIVAERLLDVARDPRALRGRRLRDPRRGRPGLGRVDRARHVAAGRGAGVAITIVRRNEEDARLHRADAVLHRCGCVEPRRAAGRDDVRDLDHRGGAWIAVGYSVDFPMSFLDGLYLVALASVFALIPSGPWLRRHPGCGGGHRHQGDRGQRRDRACPTS